MHGFIPDEIGRNDWIHGQGKATRRFGARTAMPGGHGWKAFLPAKELQNRNGLETMACTVFGSLNTYETSARQQGFADFPRNCSERFSAVLAGITPEGGSPHRACEAIRIFGVIPEEALPWTDERTWDHFYAPNPMAEEFLALGRELRRKFEFGHQWLWQEGERDKPAKLKAMLERAPVCVSVHAWTKKGTLYVKGGPDNHWVQLIDFKEGQWWEVYDHYEAVEKRLPWDYDFEQAKAYFLARRGKPVSAFVELLRELADKLQEMLYRLTHPESVRFDVPSEPLPEPQAEPVVPVVVPVEPPRLTNREHLYKVAKGCLGKDVSKTQNELGCAESVNTVHKEAFGKEIGGGTSTALMLKALVKHPDFIEVTDPLPGDIWMCATGTSTKAKHGHVGIGGKTHVMSNNSVTYKWDAHYTLAGWKAYFEKKQGFKTRYFRRVGVRN